MVVMARKGESNIVQIAKDFGVSPAGQKRWCAQCAHFCRRIKSYWCRTGSDSACFRDFPVFAGAGSRFESHLGHSKAAGQRHSSSETACTVCTGASDAVTGRCVGSRGLLVVRGTGLRPAGGDCLDLPPVGGHFVCPSGLFVRLSLLHRGCGRMEHDLLDIRGLV